MTCYVLQVNRVGLWINVQITKPFGQSRSNYQSQYTCDATKDH